MQLGEATLRNGHGEVAEAGNRVPEAKCRDQRSKGVERPKGEEGKPRVE